MAKKRLFDEHGNEVKGKLKKPFYKKVWFWILAIILIAVIGGGMGEEEMTSEPEKEAVTENTKEKDVEVKDKVEVVKKKEEEKKDDIPVEFKSALNKAKSYSNSMHMSKAGVYNQLTSEYGEKFSPEAGQYAIDNVDADWKENALFKAKTYQESMDMSPESVRDQLSSEHGENFTQEEADYAVENLDK